MSDISTPYYKILDITWILSASILAYWLRFDEAILPLDYFLPAAVLAFFANLTLSVTNFYTTTNSRFSINQALSGLSGLVIAALLTASFLYLTKTGEVYSRLWFITTITIGTGLILLSRPLLKKLFNVSIGSHSIVLVGGNRTAREVSETLDRTDQNEIRLINHFMPLQENNTLQLLHEVANWIESKRSKLSNQTSITEIWIAADIFSDSSIDEIELILSQTSVPVVYIPEMPKLKSTDFSRLEHIAGIPTINSGFRKSRKLNGLIKFLEDKIAAVLLLVILAPLFAVIAILIKIDSTGAVLYKQRRLGFSGETFSIYKFRTMTVCETEEEFVQARHNDPRVTKIGKWLRQTSLDELPQLLNVLNGTMSLVGPRPHPIKLNEEYRHSIDRYMTRHAVKPGITGLAQVNGFRGETSESWMMEGRIRCDLEYVKNWSLLLDLKIFALTIFHLVSTKNNAY